MSGGGAPQIADSEGTDLAAILRDLNRAKVAFQLRAITAAIQPSNNTPGNLTETLFIPFHTAEIDRA